MGLSGVGLWQGWFRCELVGGGGGGGWFFLNFLRGFKRSLRCPTQVQWSPAAEGCPGGRSYLGQVGEGSGRRLLLSCRSHNPDKHNDTLEAALLMKTYKNKSSHMFVVTVWRCSTCVSISCGMLCCWIHGWTSASSSLCSWVNQGWRGCSTRSFSLSSANTSVWSLEVQEDKDKDKEEEFYRLWTGVTDYGLLWSHFLCTFSTLLHNLLNTSSIEDLPKLLHLSFYLSWIKSSSKSLNIILFSFACANVSVMLLHTDSWTIFALVLVSFFILICSNLSQNIFLFAVLSFILFTYLLYLSYSIILTSRGSHAEFHCTSVWCIMTDKVPSFIINKLT